MGVHSPKTPRAVGHAERDAVVVRHVELFAEVAGEAPGMCADAPEGRVQLGVGHGQVHPLVDEVAGVVGRVAADADRDGHDVSPFRPNT